MYGKKIFCYFCFLAGYHLSFSQQQHQEIDNEVLRAFAIVRKGNLDQGYKLADSIITVSSDKDYSKGIADGYYIKSNVLYYKRDFDGSIKNAELSLNEDFTQKDYFLQSELYNYLANCYTNLGLYDEAVGVSKRMTVSSSKMKDKKKGLLYKNMAFYNLGDLYREFKKNSDSALYYYKRVFTSLEKLNKDETQKVMFSKVAMNMGVIYNALKKNEDAVYYYQQSLSNVKSEFSDSPDNILLYRHLADLYYKNQQYMLAKKYNDLYITYAEKSKQLEYINEAYALRFKISEKSKDTTHVRKDHQEYALISDSIRKLDGQNLKKAYVSIIENKNRTIDKTKKQSDKLSLYIAIMLIFIILTSLVIYSYIKKRNKQKKNIIEKKEYEISDLKSKVNDSFDELIQLAKENSPNLLARFQEVYPAFCSRIIGLDPEIQNSELIFCAYIRLNFSSKDIAQYTFVTAKSVQMRKYRLRKKFNIPSDTDIYVWMKKLDE